jgi:aspartate aminotransferase
MVILGSLSKTYAMTGWRAGFALASKPVVANLSKLQSQSTSNATSFVQKAAIAALTSSQECVAEFRAEFIDLRDYMLAALAKDSRRHLHQARRRVLRVPQHLGVPGQGRHQTATELATRLLHEAHVVTVPGEAFGTGEHIRISYPVTKQNIDEGTRRMGEFLTGLK